MIYTKLYRESLLCLIDKARLQNCDSQHIPYHMFVHVWNAGGKKGIFKA